jgi:hypothetical protein
MRPSLKMLLCGLLHVISFVFAAHVTQLANAQIATTPLTRLPDTGQTIRFTQTFGEDADFVGSVPAFKDHGNGTVTDQVTGLMWQKTDGGEMTWEKAQEFARDLKLGGHDDWRLPTSLELFSIMNHGKHGPAMDTDVFARSEARYWWTDAPRVDDSTKVWVVNTGGGIGAHAKRETISAGGDRPIHVRCVRGTSVLGTGPRLLDNGDGTVTDHRTGLIWQQRASDKPMPWEAALQACDNLELAGHSDWRLPNVKELRSLSDDQLVQPSLNKKFFAGAQAALYWSSTTQSNRPERAWFVDFTTGLVSYSDKTEPCLVIAVRGGTATPTNRDKPAPDPKLFEQGGGDRNPGGGKNKGKDKKKRP